MPPFHYRHLGSFAFIGADNAVLEVPLNGKQPSGFTGFLTGLLWKGLESYEQISLKVRSAAPSRRSMHCHGCVQEPGKCSSTQQHAV